MLSGFKCGCKNFNDSLENLVLLLQLPEPEELYLLFFSGVQNTYLLAFMWSHRKSMPTQNRAKGVPRWVQVTLWLGLDVDYSIAPLVPNLLV